MRKPGLICMNRQRKRAKALRAIAAGALLALGGLSTNAAAEPRTLHIGYQKYGTLVFEKVRGTL
jgi:hypothetical protein